MKKNIFKNIVTVFIFSILAKICSYFWELLLAYHFGTTLESDSLYMVISLFNILYPILDVAIWNVFLPIYKTKLVKNGLEKANRFANISETLFLIITLVLIIVIYIFANYIVKLFAPGFDSHQVTLTIKYLRLSLPMYIFMSTSSLIGAVLQCHNKYLGSQLREVSSHVFKILFFLVTYNYLGIYSAIFALSVGSLFRFLIQIPFINRDWKFRIDFNFKTKDVRKMINGFPSVSLTAAISQINPMFDKILASNAYLGAISVLNYGNKLVSLFGNIVSLSIATATYPTLVENIANKKEKKVGDLVTKSIMFSIFIMIPLSFFCYYNSYNIVKIAFERGQFTSDSTRLTADVFANYSLGMTFIGLTSILSNLFYAFGKIKDNLIISFLEILFNVILNIIFFRIMGVPGLALATSISSILTILIRLIIIKKIVNLEYRLLLKELIKIIITTIICIYFLQTFNNILFSNNVFGLFTSLVITGSIYLILNILLNSESLKFIISIIKDKFTNKT